jgi:hypothetical protein
MSFTAGVGKYFMDEKSDFKKNNEEKKEEDLKKLIAEAGNGKGKLEGIEEPIILKLQLSFWLDRQKIKDYEIDKIVLYLIDCFLRDHEQLVPIAEKLKHEVMGKPRLIIPSSKLVH